MAAVILQNVSKVYRRPGSLAEEHRVIDGVSLHIAESSFCAIMGPSGCGKSTLLNIIAGLETPSEGDVLVGSQPLNRLTLRARDDFRLQNIAYVFQFFHLLPTLTLLENACLPAFEKFPKARGHHARQAAKLFERLGLSTATQLFPAQVSGGMQARTALARAVLSEPRVLLCDEPTGNLDSATGETVLSLIDETHRTSGCTVVLVTHDATAAARAQTRILMRDGRLS